MRTISSSSPRDWCRTLACGPSTRTAGSPRVLVLCRRRAALTFLFAVLTLATPAVLKEAVEYVRQRRGRARKTILLDEKGYRVVDVIPADLAGPLFQEHTDWHRKRPPIAG